jgi:hypothetical protein
MLVVYGLVADSKSARLRAIHLERRFKMTQLAMIAAIAIVLSVPLLLLGVVLFGARVMADVDQHGDDSPKWVREAPHLALLQPHRLSPSGRRAGLYLLLCAVGFATAVVLLSRIGH